MGIRAVIWDLGGVLVRTEDFTPREALASRLGVRRAELEHLIFNSESGRRAQLGEISPAELWQEVAAVLGIAPEDLPSVEHAFWEGDMLDRELIGFIRSLQDRYTTALLSNAWRDLRRALTDKWGIDDAFHQIVISAEAGIMKPDPRIYHLALERVGALPEEAVFLDDFEHNIAGARAVGMFGIHFQQPGQVRRDLEALLASES